MPIIFLHTKSLLYKLIKKVLLGTFVVEGVGALLYMSVFVPEFGLRGIWISIFTSISAFCNAGFDLMGTKTPYSSLTHFVNHPVINVVILSLIVIGGIGFLTWEDIKIHRWRFRRFRLHSC